jgi:hypothetical protein
MRLNRVDLRFNIASMVPIRTPSPQNCNSKRTYQSWR